ncbi:MAG: hypothetical protein HYW71_02030 [Candidatus Niyogibacteria bacterium]|nr:hypothetical protein [Candidatus Niyogibacteria bacterium]
MAKPNLVVVKDLKDLGKKIEEKKINQLRATISGPVIDVDALLADIPLLSEKEIREEHRNYMERKITVGHAIIEMQQKKLELERALLKIKGTSPVKEKVSGQIKQIDSKIQSIYNQMPGLKQHVEYELLLKRTIEGKHFGDLNVILKKGVFLSFIEKHSLSFQEARERFPKTTIIIYGGEAYIIKGFKLGKELIALRKRAVSAAEKLKQ